MKTARLFLILICAALLSISLVSTSAFSAPSSDTAHVEHQKMDKYNINEASAEELTAIPGVGPKIAESIIEYRKTNGNFKSVDDLLKVKGIGPKKLEKMKDYIML